MNNSEEYWANRKVLVGFYLNKGKATDVICEALEGMTLYSIFEFGCGTGRNLHYIIEGHLSIIRAVGIDINYEILSVGKQEFSNLILINSHNYEYKESFDVCFTASALTHIESLCDVTEIIENLLYTCKTLILLEPFTGKNIPAFPEYTITPHTYFWDYKSILQELGCKDFEVIDSPLCDNETKLGVGKYYKLWKVR